MRAKKEADCQQTNNSDKPKCLPLAATQALRLCRTTLCNINYKKHRHRKLDIMELNEIRKQWYHRLYWVVEWFVIFLSVIAIVFTISQHNTIANEALFYTFIMFFIITPLFPCIIYSIVLWVINGGLLREYLAFSLNKQIKKKTINDNKFNSKSTGKIQTKTWGGILILIFYSAFTQSLLGSITKQDNKLFSDSIVEGVNIFLIVSIFFYIFLAKRYRLNISKKSILLILLIFSNSIQTRLPVLKRKMRAQENLLPDRKRDWK